MIRRPAVPSSSVRSSEATRAVLGLVAAAIAVAGVLVATDGAVFSPAPPTVALTPAVTTTCATVGENYPPEPGGSGLPAGTQTCRSGSLHVTTPGAVLDGMDVTGGVLVDAPDVVIRRSRVTGDGTAPFGIATTPAGSVRIEDTTVTGEFLEAAVAGDRLSAERIDVTAVTTDGVRLGARSRMRGSKVRLTPPPGRFPVGVDMTSAPTTLEDTQVDAGPGAANAVRISAGGRLPRDATVVVRANILGGGQVTLLHDDGPSPEVWITGNLFARDSEVPMRVGRGAVVDDNAYADGGRLPPR